MDKVWFYIAGIAVGLVALTYIVFSVVRSTIPPAY